MARVLSTGQAAIVSMADFNDRVKLVLANKPIGLKPGGRRKVHNWALRTYNSK